VALRNTVICGNAAAMDALPDASVDLIFTSPPYESRKRYGDDASGDLGRLQGDAFLGALEPVLRECYRVLAPTGNLFINFQGQYIDRRMSLVQVKIPVMAVERVGFEYVQDFHWTKTNARPDNYARRLRNRNEVIYHLVKDIDQYQVNKDAVRVPHRHGGRGRKCELCNSLVPGKADRRAHKYNPLGADPGNVVFMPTSTGQGSRDTSRRDGAPVLFVHPGLMPGRLAEFFVRYGSPESGLVLDPFMGSGTTGVAAAALGRDYIGYDVYPEYVEQAIARCAAVAGTEPPLQLELSF